MRTPQTHDVRQLPSQGAKKELPLSASFKGRNMRTKEQSFLLGEGTTEWWRGC